jgi:hypothetical protein
MYKTRHFVHMSSPPIRKNGRFWPSAPISLPWNNTKKQRFGQLADLRFSRDYSVFRPYPFPENALILAYPSAAHGCLLHPKASAHYPNLSAAEFSPLLPAFLLRQNDSMMNFPFLINMANFVYLLPR